MGRFHHIPALVILLACAPPIEAQESFDAGRMLYASAEYDRALAIFDGLLAANRPRTERRSIELYRTLCLLAVGRTDDADRAIEGIVSADPMFRPSADDIPPRLRQAFSEARRRLLPAIVQQRYASAKTAFDREDYAEASDGFGRVLEALGDPDIAAAAAQPPLSDLRTLALGFHDLSEKLDVPRRPETPAAPAPPAADRARVYTAADPRVAPPVVISQAIPTYRGRITSSDRGVLEVIVDATGAVESATMRIPVNSAYDRHVLNSAKHWKYQPATMDGVPVRFRKLIQVAIAVTPEN